MFFFCSLHSMINADFCVAGCLIAYGAVLGKVSPVQLLVMTLFGVTLFAVEEYIILDLIHVSFIEHRFVYLTPSLLHYFIQTQFHDLKSIEFERGETPCRRFLFSSSITGYFCSG